ncbi:MAG: hypothetical protein EPO40_18905 [Myxococcaceae bacterium]|nr:MAG: hypothetical protein EPO40_18905 [Myxococcaceae bacterium]
MGTMNVQSKARLILIWIGILGLCVAGCAKTRLPYSPRAGDASVDEPSDAPQTFGLPTEPTDQELRQASFFHEPLVSIGGASEDGENRALARAIRTDLERGDPYATDALDEFVRTHPQSHWRASLLTNLGLLYRRMGRYQEALDAWDEAWSLTSSEVSVDGRAIADRAVSELALLNAELGRRGRLDELAISLEHRPPLGSAAERYARAQTGRAMMEAHPERSYRCGPLAVSSMWAVLHPGAPAPEALLSATSTADGTSLAQLIALGNEAGEPLRALRREPSTPWLVPSVIHWKVNHFAAVVAVEEVSPGRRVYLLQDPTFGESVRVSERWLDEGASGYVLIPARSPIPPGWMEVGASEAATIWGRGETTETDPDAFGDRDLVSPCDSSRGVARFGFHRHLASLHVEDTPVWLNTAFGPPVEFRVSYNQADWTQPQLPTYANFGGRWTFNFGGALTSSSTGPVYAWGMNGGGVVRLDPVINPVTDLRSGDRLEDVPGVPDDKRIRHRDGSYDLYRRLSAGFSTRWFLKERRDAQNNAVILTYDGLRLTTITAADNQTLTIGYRSDVPGTQSYYLVSTVTTSAGYVANFTYAEREPGGPYVLTATADSENVTSYYSYSTVNRTILDGGLPIADDAGVPIPDRDFLASISTPYGLTAFTTGWGQVHGAGSSNNLFIQRWTEAAYPTGEHERVEFRQIIAASGDCDATSTYTGLMPCFFRPTAEELFPPAYMAALGGDDGDHAVNLDFRNSYYWNVVGYARARSVSGGLVTFDPRHANVYHWIHRPWPSMATSALLESEVPPGESRIYYAYEQQTSPQFLPTLTGSVTWYRPVMVARLQQDGSPSTQQVSRATYTVHGNVEQSFDAMNRTRCLTWSADGTDLLSVHALPCSLLPPIGREAVSTERLVRLEYEGSLHLPYRVTDAAGQVTRHYYNVRGQLVRSVLPDSRTVNVLYSQSSTFAGTGTTDIAPSERFPYLIAMTGGGAFGSSPLRSFSIGTYSDGMRASVTDPEGVQRSFAWDRIGRLLSVSSSRGQQTFDYRIRNEDGSVVGTLTGLEPTRVTLENGDTLTRAFDALRRPIRVATVGEVVRYRYNQFVGTSLDAVQKLRGDSNNDVLTRWTVGAAPLAMAGGRQGPVNPLFQQAPTSRTRALGTPNEFASWGRDAVGRVVDVTQDTQAWRVGYRADGLPTSICEGTSCAGTPPRTDFQYEPVLTDPTTYTHMQRLRVISRSNDTINGSHQQEIRYVPFGSNGALNRGFVQDTTPFGLTPQSVTIGYDVLGRVQTATTPTDTLAFYYDSLGRRERVTSSAYPGQNLLRFLYGAGDTSSRPTFEEMPVYGCNASRGYDGTHDFLLSGRSVTPTASSTEIIGFARTYDLRNRVATEQVVGGNRYHQYDSSGRIMWSDDYIGGNWLYRDNYYDAFGNLNNFARSGSAPPFSEIMTFDVLDRIQIRSRTGSPGIWVTQDSRGRVTDDGDFTYTWDANDRLRVVTRVADGTSWQFRYDSAGRLRRFQEGGIWHGLSWVGGRLYGEYLGSETTQSLPVRLFHADGMTQGGVRYRFERDARGSIRAVVNNGQVAHSWAYDTWGNRTDAGGPVGGLEPRLAFAGYVMHGPTGLLFTPGRVYQPALRRWLSRDPLGERISVDGDNLYAYGANDPVNNVDSMGLWVENINSQQLGDFASYIGGVGDSLTFGLSGAIRDGLGMGDEVDQCSGYFRVGQAAGAFIGLAAGGGGGGGFVRPLEAADLGLEGVVGLDLTGTVSMRGGQMTMRVGYLGAPPPGISPRDALGAIGAAMGVARQAGASALRLETTPVINARLAELLSLRGFSSRTNGTMWRVIGL